MEDHPHREKEHFFGAAKLMALWTLVSRVMGMLRASAIASLGATRANDAFSLAWRIPNLFRRLLGEGALQSAFVPAFTESMEKDGHDKANRLLANAMGLLAATLGAILVLILSSLFFWARTIDVANASGQDTLLLIGLTATMISFMATACLMALASGALNCRGHFAYPAAAPVLLNLVVIAGAWWAAPYFRQDIVGQLYIIAASVSVAGVLQLIGAFILLRHYGLAVRPRLWPIEPGIRNLVRTMAPMLIGLGFLQFNELLESGVAWVLTATSVNPTITIFGSTFHRPLDPGVLARVDAARYLYQFPMGVLANSLAVAVFPLMSRYSARGDMVNLRDTLNRALRLAFLEGLAAGVGLFVLAEPITQLLYAYRRFTPADAMQAAFILRMYVLGMAAYCTYQIFARAFYSVKDTLTPMKISLCLMLPELAMISMLVWVPWLGAGAFGLTTAIIFTINTAILAIKLRSRLGLYGGKKLARSIARSLIACAVMAGAIVAAWWGLGVGAQEVASNLLAGKAWGFHLLVVVVCVPLGAGVFVLTLRLLNAPELGELFGSLRKKKLPTEELEKN